MDNAVNSSTADAVRLGDLAQAQAAAVIAEDRIAIELERTATDMPAFEPGARFREPRALPPRRLGCSVQAVPNEHIILM